jgi:hypothetical protein
VSDDKVRVCAMLSVLLCISIGISSDLPVDSSYPCLLLSDGGDNDDNEILLLLACVDNDDDARVREQQT